MSVPVRIALVAVGLAVAVCGIASLTGEWLGTPPWWDDAAARYRSLDPVARADWIDHDLFVEIRRDGSSFLVVAAGFYVATFGVWPRRRGPVS